MPEHTEHNDFTSERERETGGVEVKRIKRKNKREQGMGRMKERKQRWQRTGENE